MSSSDAKNSRVLKVLATNIIHGVFDELLPAFRSAQNIDVDVSFDPAQVMLKRLADGERADLLILPQSAIDALTQEGRVDPASRRTLARCGIGVGVRAGAAKPDVTTVEALKRTLLRAESIAHTTRGASGIHFMALIERLGIAAAVRAKAVTDTGGLIGKLVANGHAQIAIQQMPELMAVPGVDVAGPLPQELQQISVVTVGICTDAEAPEAAAALIEFLFDPQSLRVFRAKGLEPT